jgi:outer membrane lipoprotein-sorting protein
MKTICIPIVMFLFLVVPLSASAQKADEILAKYLENTGGIEKWKNLKSLTASGKSSFGPQEFPIAITSKTPNLMRIDINVQGQKIVQASDGKEAWMINPFQGGTEPQKLTDEQAKELTERYLESEFIDYKKKGHEVTLDGEEDLEGVKCYKIKLIKNKLNDKEDVMEYHFFDKENYVPIAISTFGRSGPTKGMEVRQFLSDYQEVDGLMFPFFTEVKVNGQTLQKMTFEKFTLNPPVDDTIFAFPKK